MSFERFHQILQARGYQRYQPPVTSYADELWQTLVRREHAPADLNGGRLYFDAYLYAPQPDQPWAAGLEVHVCGTLFGLAFRLEGYSLREDDPALEAKLEFLEKALVAAWNGISFCNGGRVIPASQEG